MTLKITLIVWLVGFIVSFFYMMRPGGDKSLDGPNKVRDTMLLAAVWPITGLIMWMAKKNLE